MGVGCKEEEPGGRLMKPNGMQRTADEMHKSPDRKIKDSPDLPGICTNKELNANR